jgi:hypothetical protein
MGWRRRTSDAAGYVVTGFFDLSKSGECSAANKRSKNNGENQ